MPLLASFPKPHLERNKNADVLLLQPTEMNETKPEPFPDLHKATEFWKDSGFVALDFR